MDTRATTNDPVPEGAHPAKQERSRQLRDRMIACGRALVEQGGFAGTSMADIAREAGCSVGALYFRFRDKDALFECVAEVAMSESLETVRARESSGRYRLPTIAATVHAIVEDYVDHVRNNKSMFRAVYQHALEDPRHWAIVRNAGYEMVSIWTSAIVAIANRPGDVVFRRQVKVAMVHLTSVLIYATLIPEPPGRQPTREEQIHWLWLAATQIIWAPPLLLPVTGAGKVAPGRSKGARAAPRSSSPRSPRRR